MPAFVTTHWSTTSRPDCEERERKTYGLEEWTQSRICYTHAWKRDCPTIFSGLCTQSRASILLPTLPGPHHSCCWCHWYDSKTNDAQECSWAFPWPLGMTQLAVVTKDISDITKYNLLLQQHYSAYCKKMIRHFSRFCWVMDLTPLNTFFTPTRKCPWLVGWTTQFTCTASVTQWPVTVCTGSSFWHCSPTWSWWQVQKHKQYLSTQQQCARACVQATPYTYSGYQENIKHEYALHQVLILFLLLSSSTQRKWLGMIVVRGTLKTFYFPFLKTCSICFFQTVSPHIFRGAKSTPLHKKVPTKFTKVIACWPSMAVSRLFANVVRDLLTDWALAEHQIPDSQFGFCPTRNTNQPLFVLCHTLATAKKEKMVYTLFLDFFTAYDGIPRKKLWRHLQKIWLHSISGISFIPCTYHVYTKDAYTFSLMATKFLRRLRPIEAWNRAALWVPFWTPF